MATQDNRDTRADAELVAAINAGDSEAFEILYFRHRDWVAGLAFRFTGDEDAALDVLQETFLYLLRKFPGFRLTAQLKTFLYPAIRNLSIAANRKARRYQADEQDRRRLDETAAPLTQAGRSDDLAVVLDCIPQEQREVLLLRFVDGLALAEIAEAMEIPTGTVKSRLHSALQALRQDPRTKEFFCH